MAGVKETCRTPMESPLGPTRILAPLQSHTRRSNHGIKRMDVASGAKSRASSIQARIRPRTGHRVASSSSIFGGGGGGTSEKLDSAGLWAGLIDGFGGTGGSGGGEAWSTANAFGSKDRHREGVRSGNSCGGGRVRSICKPGSRSDAKCGTLDIEGHPAPSSNNQRRAPLISACLQTIDHSPQ